MVFQSGLLLKRIRDVSLDAQERWLDNLDKDQIRADLHVYVDKMCDYCFDPVKLLKEVQSFSNALYYIFLAAAFYALWYLTYFFWFAIFVLTTMTVKYFLRDYDVTVYASVIANTCAALWNKYQIHFVALGTAIVLAEICHPIINTLAENLYEMKNYIEPYKWMIYLSGVFAAFFTKSHQLLFQACRFVLGLIKHCSSFLVQIFLTHWVVSFVIGIAVLFWFCRNRHDDIVKTTNKFLQFSKAVKNYFSKNVPAKGDNTEDVAVVDGGDAVKTTPTKYYNKRTKTTIVVTP